jgi:unsaturated rhamnogalacturonyl hydrolase
LENNYSRRITFNDGAFTGVMNLLKKMVEGSPDFSFVDNTLLSEVKTAYEKGLECILKCQIREKGQLTAWCQQHDENTLQPAWARAYEPPSICNGESVQVVLLLMGIDHPDKLIIEAIEGAVKWFNESKIYHTRVKTIQAPPEKSQWKTITTDRIVVTDTLAPPIWTRYYELETERPLFSDRNSKFFYSLAEVSRERRSGYSWYTYDPQKALDQYPLWKSKIQGKEENGLRLAVKMADSEITLFPEPWTVDFNPKPAWNYTQGLIAQSMLQLWKVNHQKAYFDYAKKYADKFIDPIGVITGYKAEEFSLDLVNSGKFLFELYQATKDERYLKAVKQLRDQFKSQPRTSEGGFWHKLRYPNQMWLDGLYMGAPFYAQYAARFNDSAAFDDVVNQFIVVHKHTYDAKTGLNYHGWDESKMQKWANPVTGCSPCFWGRAMGWYAMALVDVLDYIPRNHVGRSKLIEILKQVASGIKKYQDPSTGLWYQVLDQGNREGNYLEATVSSMFTYTLLKASRKGYINKEYKAIAIKGYSGIVRNLIRTNENGTISLTRCCAVAGLGGNPYRDGSYEYYVHELVRDNDPKGVGPFILASLEFSEK